MNNDQYFSRDVFSGECFGGIYFRSESETISVFQGD